MTANYKGKLYYEYNQEIILLIKLGRLNDAEKLLRELIAAIESDTYDDFYPPSWYYNQLASVYRKKGDTTNEIKTLETFVAKYGSGRTTLHERLETLKRNMTIIH